MSAKHASKELHERWKADVAFQYDHLTSCALDTECLALAWLPQQARGPDDITTQRLALGLNYTDNPCISISRVILPTPTYRQPSTVILDAPQLQPISTFAHPGDVRSLSVNPTGRLLCSASTTSELYIYDLTTVHTPVDSDQQQADLDFDPVPYTYALASQREPALATTWNPHQPEVVAASSSDSGIRIWHLSSPQPPPAANPPATTLTHHTGPVGGLTWQASTVLASAGDDRTLALHDCRQAPTSTPAASTRLPSTPNSLATLTPTPDHPTHDTPLAAALQSGTIKFYDPRNLAAPLASTRAHHGAALQLTTAVVPTVPAAAAQNPSSRSKGQASTPAVPTPPSKASHILASTGADGSIKIWDWQQILSSGPSASTQHPAAAAAASSASGAQRLAARSGRHGATGRQGAAGESAEVPPGLLFVHVGHVGHRAEVMDMCWNRDAPGMLASVSGGTDDEVAPVVHVWRPHCLHR